MAPRKQVARRSKRSQPDSEIGERRSKFCQDPRARSSQQHRVSSSPPPAAAPPPSPPQTNSPPPLVLDKALPFASRAVTTGRRIDFNFLNEELFNLGVCLRAQGWEYLCSLNLPTYPNLVRQFYACAKVTATAFESEVKGIKISLSVEKLGELLQVPVEGAERLVDRSQGLRLLLGRDDILDWEEAVAGKLSVEHRLLHHMTARIFLPRIGRFDFLTKGDVAIMFFILMKEQFNLPAVMLRIMQETRTRAKSALPYGMFLTLVFTAFGVNFEGEPFRQLQHYDTYTAKTLTRMGYLKFDGAWVKKGEVRGREEEEVSTAVPVPSRRAHASSSTQNIRLDADQMEEIIEKVSDRVVDRISGHLTQMFQDFVARQQSIPPTGPTLD